MRTWGRVTDPSGVKKWVAVETTPEGDDTLVWLTTLIQTLKLGLGESPFYAQYGIPAQQAIIQQIAPDYYVNVIQQQYAQYFSSLTVTRVQNTESPTYAIKVITLDGASYTELIPV